MLSEQTGGHFQSERTDFNPFDLSLAINGFSLQGPDHAEVASFGEFSLDVDVGASVKSNALVVKGKITRPSINILIDQQGKPNFAFLLPTQATPKEPTKPLVFPFLLTQFGIEHGRLAFEDRSRGAGFKTVIAPLDASMENFGTSANTEARFKLFAKEDGKELISSDGDLHLVQSSVTGDLQLQDIKLAPLAAWLVSQEGYVVSGGLLSVKLKYSYDTNGNLQIPSLQAVVKELSLDKDSQPFLTVGSATATELSYQLQTNQLQLKSLGLENLSLKGPVAFAIGSVKTLGLGFDMKSNRLRLESIAMDKIGLEAPFRVAIGSVKTQGLGFDMQANQLKLESIAVEMIGLEGTTPVAVGSIKTQGLGFDMQANQLRLESIAVEKMAINGPATLDVGSVNLQRLGFDIKTDQLNLDSIGLANINFKEPAPVDVTSISAVGLGFSVQAKQLQLKSLAVEKIELQTPTPVREENGKKRLVSVGSLKLDEIGMSLAEQSLHIGKAATQNAILAAWLKRDGTLGIPGLPPANTSVSPKPAEGGNESPSSKPWTFAVDVMELNKNDLALRDFNYDPPITQRLSPLNLLVKGFSSESGKPFWLGMNTGLSMNGRIALEGKVKLSPPTASFKVYVDDLSLPAFQAYLDKSVGFRLVKGTLNLNADIDYENQGQQHLRFGGDAAVANFVSDDLNQGKDFINFDNLRINGIIYENTPQRLSIREVTATEPYIRAIIYPNRKFNIAENLNPPPPPKSEEKNTGQAESTSNRGQSVEPMNVVIGVVHINQADADFTDMSIKPTNFSISIHDLSGDIRSLSSNLDSKSDVNLVGKLDEGSPAKIFGQVNLFSVKLFTDIVMNFNDVNLTTLSPYSSKFAGYRIEKGKISMDLHYKLENGQLTAKNKFVLNQLTLGERVESPEATSLPVSLAISLLKDANGQIDIDLPISGDLSNPHVDIWGLLGDAATTLISKLIAAPFNLLANLFGGSSEEDLGTVKFSPGQAELSRQEKDDLDKLAKGLQDRPALNLEIKGTAHPALDSPALAEQGLDRQLKNTKLIELGKTKGKESEWDVVALSNEDYARLLTNLYRSKYPDAPELQGVKINQGLQGDPLQNAKRKLLEKWIVSEVDLRLLAQARGKSIRNYMTQAGGLPDQRIYLLDVKLLAPEEKEIKSLLSLSSN